MRTFTITYKKLNAGTLPTVMVIAVLMMLSVLAMLSLWKNETFLFEKANYNKARRADIEAGFILYENHPGIVRHEEETNIILYDGIPHSEIKISHRTWGLYEVVSVSSKYGKTSQTRIMGCRGKQKEPSAFFYTDNSASLTITGDTNIKGVIHAPAKGIIYGQMRSIFFSGEKLSHDMIKQSEQELPPSCGQAENSVLKLFGLFGSYYPVLTADSLTVSFYGQEPLIFNLLDEDLYEYALAGNIILVGDHIYIDSSNRFKDIIVVANNITIGQGFRGSIQVFAMDTVITEEDSTLDFPSGIYARNYAEISKNSVVNGYVIVEADDKSNVREANYKQIRTAKTRGLLYIDGNAQLQGIVSGKVFLDKAVYYSSEGYYKDMLLDATILHEDELPLPVWLSSVSPRENIKRVK